MRRFKVEILASVLLLAVTVIPLAQVVGHDFVNYDDNVYVTENFLIQTPLDLDNVWTALTQTKRSGHWHPLTWISLSLDYNIYGLNPLGFHLTNLILHSLNVLLLFAVLRLGTNTV